MNNTMKWKLLKFLGLDTEIVNIVKAHNNAAEIIRQYGLLTDKNRLVGRSSDKEAIKLHWADYNSNLHKLQESYLNLKYGNLNATEDEANAKSYAEVMPEFDLVEVLAKKKGFE